MAAFKSNKKFIKSLRDRICNILVFYFGMFIFASKYISCWNCEYQTIFDSDWSVDNDSNQL